MGQLRVRLARIATIRDRGRREMDVPERADAADLGRRIQLLEHGFQTRLQAIAQRVQVRERRGGQQLQGGQAGAGGERIAGERAALVDARTALPGVESVRRRRAARTAP